MAHLNSQRKTMSQAYEDDNTLSYILYRNTVLRFATAGDFLVNGN